MKSKPRTARGAFTLPELLVTLFLVMLVVVVVLPMLAGRNVRPLRIQCVNNLKQVGLAFRIWSNDRTGTFPMAVSTNRGGTAEVAGDVWRTFQSMSNELSALKILTCPSDKDRSPAKSFASLSNANISYFIGLDGHELRPEVLLAGDRNLTSGLPEANRVLTISSNTPVGWTSELHNSQGNIGLSDGSVQQVSNSRLQPAVQNALRSHYEATTNATLRLAMP